MNFNHSFTYVELNWKICTKCLIRTRCCMLLCNQMHGWLRWYSTGFISLSIGITSYGHRAKFNILLMQHTKTHKVYLKTTNNPAKQRSSYTVLYVFHVTWIHAELALWGCLQSGQPLGMFATASALFVQKRVCPQGTRRATPVRGAIRQTSHMSGVAIAADAVTVAVAADDGVEGSASSSSANWNASVCAPKLWLMARRQRTCWNMLCLVFGYVKSVIFQVLHFPAPAIRSFIFQVLQIPGLRFGPSFSRCCNFQSLFFCGPTFSGPANSAPPIKWRFVISCWPDCKMNYLEWPGVASVMRNSDFVTKMHLFPRFYTPSYLLPFLLFVVVMYTHLLLRPR